MIEIVARIIQSSLSTYGAVYLATAILNPNWFISNMSIREMENVGIKNWLFWLKMGLGGLGIAFLTYSAMYAVVAVVPYTLGGYDMEGSWESLRDTIRALASIAATLALIPALDKNAEKIVLFGIELSARDSFQRTIENSTVSNKKTTLLAIAELQKNLAVDEFIHHGWKKRKQERFLNGTVESLKSSRSFRRLDDLG